MRVEPAAASVGQFDRPAHTHFQDRQRYASGRIVHAGPVGHAVQSSGRSARDRLSPEAASRANRLSWPRCASCWCCVSVCSKAANLSIPRWPCRIRLDAARCISPSFSQSHPFVRPRAIPSFNRDGRCKEKIALWPGSFKRASFFVRFEWPFLRPGLLMGRRRAQGLSRRAGRPPRSGLVLIAPSTVPCLGRTGAFKVQAPGFSASLPAGVTVLSGGSKSCRSMAGNRDGANSGQSTKTCHFALVSKHGIYRGAGVKETRHGSKTCRGQLRTPQPDRQASASTNQPPKLRQS